MAVAVHLLVFCALLLNAASPIAVRSSGVATNLTCAGNFTLRELACYSYSGSEIKRSFHQAERHCSKLRASLASLLSPSEESFVLELTDNESSIWIGLTKQDSADGFRWTDGAKFSLHAHWQEGEPSASSHLHCAMAARDGWALARGGCASTKLPFVCKKQACPEGLEWSGKDCDIITNLHSPPPSLHFGCPSLTMVLVIMSLSSLLLTAAYWCTSLHSSNCRWKHHKPSSLPSHKSIQELWLT